MLEFTKSEQEHLYHELQDINTTHQRRFDIGKRLAEIGDYREGIGVKDGFPDIKWLPIIGTDSQKVEFIGDRGKFGEFIVPDFFIAKYLTTNEQFQTFLDSDWDNPKWWQGFAEKFQNVIVSRNPQKFREALNPDSNAPRDSVSWYQSVAFSRWMNEQLQGMELSFENGNSLIVGDKAEIRLPSEQEWQWVAQNGAEGRKYPWGNWDDYPRANTGITEIGRRSTAVGMYPHGQAVCGALDMSGNLYEWCLNDYDKPEITNGFDKGSRKVIRGGTFYNHNIHASASYRSSNYPYIDSLNFGCRVVLSPILPRITS